MNRLFVLVMVVIAFFGSLPAAHAQPAGVVTDAYSLIAAVNSLRASNGLAPYTISPILMGVAQAHADYMAANGIISHTGAGGSTATSRILAAGYPLAGDLSLGGIRAENITGGTRKSVYDAVQEWTGDAPHLNTMLHPSALEIGAGVAYRGDTVYYVIDVALPKGGAYVAPTLPGGTPGLTATTVVYAPPLVSTVFPNTPGPDGRVIHTVKGGETLWLIAITYGVTVAEIRQLNGMSEEEAIYPGEVLVIRVGLPTATFAAPTGAITRSPTSSPGNNAAPTTTATVPAPTPSNMPEVVTSQPEDGNGLAVVSILLAALLLAGVLAFSFVPRK